MVCDVQEVEAVEHAVASCSGTDDAPVVVYVSKMVATPAGQLPRRPNEAGPPDPLEERFLAFGRVFSGTVRDGQELYVLPSVYDPGRQDPAPATVRVSSQIATVLK
jgi:ribosome assembly protein 1